MGGKVGMFLAWLYPDKVRKLAVIDIAPRSYPPHHEAELAGMSAVDPATLPDRTTADVRMAKFVSNPATRQFLLKNLHRTDDGKFAWRHNVSGLAAAQESIGAALPPEATIDCPLLFVRGGSSSYITQADERDIRIRFAQVQIETVEGASHWVQVDKPAALQYIISRFFA